MRTFKNFSRGPQGNFGGVLAPQETFWGGFSPLGKILGRFGSGILEQKRGVQSHLGSTEAGGRQLCRLVQLITLGLVKPSE